ncbi:hypothetical protein D3C84_704390 [compost metagenome]
MMIGRSFRRSSWRIKVATSKPSMRGISISSSMMSGRCSCSRAMASTPSLAVSTFMPLRSSRRLVTLRTVTESSTTITNGGRSTSTSAGSRLALAERSCGCTRCAWRVRMVASRSRITTTRPSPRMVAPEMPWTPANCAPRLFTTISREPTRASTCTATACSLERTRITGSGRLWPTSLGCWPLSSRSPRYFSS